MYTVFKFNLPQGNRKFPSYEKARQTVRKWIRKGSGLPINLDDLFWNSNPSIGIYGYSIRKV